MSKKNFRLKISYDGTRYSGWEHQPGKDTIQGKIEMVLARMIGLDPTPEEFFGDNEPVEVIASGRTDAGVHAKAQVANAVLDTDLSAEEIRDYVNTYLPDDIAVTDVKEVSERFHARYNAVGKTYLDTPVDVDAMQKAAEYLVGEHDFKSFCGNPKMKKSTVRVVDKIEIKRSKGYIYFTIHGTGFLQNMVRILVGTLLEVGAGRMQPEDVPGILEAKDRKVAGPTAPAKGLCLVKVDY